MSSDSTLLKAVSLQLDELTKGFAEMRIAILQLRDDNLKTRIDTMHIKLDTVLGDGASGLTIVTDQQPAVKKAGKAAEPAVAGSEEVKDPGAIEGNIIEFFKGMWISHFPILLEKKLVTVEHERKRAEIEEKNKDTKRGSTDAQRKEANAVYKVLKDDQAFKDTLVAFRNSQNIEYVKSNSTRVSVETIA